MAEKRDVIGLLRSFSVRKRSHLLPMTEFVRFTEKYVEQRVGKQPELRDLGSDTHLKLTTALEEIGAEGTCTLEYAEGKISSITFPEFYLAIVRKQFSELDSNDDLPFPTEASLGITLPSEQITPVDVKSEFVAVLEENRFQQPQLIRLMFPEGINSAVVPSDLVDSGLMKLSLARIRQYLGIQKNAFYMISKLRSVFKTKEQVVRDMINNVLTQRQQATESLVNPTEFSFSFWTHLANAIIKELRDKTNKLEREHTFCQAAYLIGFYAVQHKTERRKEKDTQAAYKVLDRKLHSEPYVFTVSEIAAFTDDQGVPLTKRYTRNELHAYIERKSRPSEEALPEIIRLKAAAKEYFVTKEVVLPLTLKKITEASKEQAKHYTESFLDAMQKSKKLPEMKSDQAFLTDVEKRIKGESPLLSSMLNFDLMFLLLQEVKPRAEVASKINRLLKTEHQSLIQMDEVLDLSRKELLNQAKMQLPFWKTVPVISKLFGMLGRFASGKQSSSKSAQRKRRTTQPVTRTGKKSPAGRASGSQDGRGSSVKVLGGDAEPSGGAQARPKNPSVVLQNAMSKLKVEFVGTASLQESMSSLIERWNPLFDPEAKSNLVEDVNSLIRDFLRKLKHSFLVKPPNAARIRTMAESLADNQAFEKVKRKQDLMRYIELYMIKVLGGK